MYNIRIISLFYHRSLIRLMLKSFVEITRNYIYYVYTSTPLNRVTV